MPSQQHTTQNFRARLRFRLQKKLNIDRAEHTLTVGGRDVILSSPVPDRAIKDSHWLVLNARGFCTLDEARIFGQSLKLAVELASIATRLGIDTGIDVATAGVGQFVRDLALQRGQILRDNVHGVDAFEDDPRVRIFSFEASGSVLANHEPFLPFAAELFEPNQPLSLGSQNAIILLNSALMEIEPVGQIVFAVSAVEMLGQDLRWSPAQKSVLEQLAASAREHTDLTPDEGKEVASAIQKLHRLSLRQGVLRLLERLGLPHLRRPWDELYEERSALMHAAAPRRAANYGELASKAVTLCGYILLKAIATEHPHVGRYADCYFQVPSAQAGQKP